MAAFYQREEMAKRVAICESARVYLWVIASLTLPRLHVFDHRWSLFGLTRLCGLSRAQ